MIHFMRKSHFDDLIQNKVVKYLLNAVGEIFLVVIGILIAISLDNLNSERKAAQQEYQLLLSLKSDLLESKERLLSAMDSQKEILRCNIALIHLYEGGISLSDTDSIKFYLVDAFAWFRAELVTGTYDALINAGNSELIKNDKLRKILAEFNSILKAGFEDQESSMNLINNMEIIAAPVLLTLTEPSTREFIGLDTISNPNVDDAIKFLFAQDAFFGHLYFKTLIEKLRYGYQQDLFSRITEILFLINKELEKSNNQNSKTIQKSEN